MKAVSAQAEANASTARAIMALYERLKREVLELTELAPLFEQFEDTDTAIEGL